MTSFAFIFGVVPLVVAAGAGAEMRRSLGTAVFSGMLGVTLFGIFLTPVFFYVDPGARRDAAVLGRPRRDGSARPCWGACSGAAIGYLLGRLGVVRPAWALGDRWRRGRSSPGWRSRGFSGASSRRPTSGRGSSSSPAIRSTRAEIRSRDLALLHRSADLRHGDLGGHHAGGRRGGVHAAGRAVSRGDAAHGAGDGPLSRAPTRTRCATPWRRRSRSRSAASRA